MKTLWACEPFHQDPKQTLGFFKLMSEIAGSKDFVEAAFVVTRTETDLSLAFDVPMEERFTEYPRQQLLKALKKARVQIPENHVSVVDYPTLSNTKAVDRFPALANEKKAELVGLFTHSRHGYKRLLLGSFAETAIHRSQKNLLLATPLTKFPSRVRGIFFLSDFTEDSKVHLKKVLDLCQRLRSKLVVFHAAQVIYRRSHDETSKEVINYREQVNSYRDWVAKECEKAGVKTEIKLSSDFSLASEAALKDAAKSKSDLVVVVAKSGPGTALMGGSVTRQVVRASQLPVLVLKAKA